MQFRGAVLSAASTAAPINAEASARPQIAAKTNLGRVREEVD